MVTKALYLNLNTIIVVFKMHFLQYQLLLRLSVVSNIVIPKISK